MLGYGFPDDTRAIESNSYTAILFFQGKLEPNNVAFFDIPVPSVLAAAGDGKKRLTVTVVHAPEVQRWGLERYLGTTLKWRLFRGNVTREKIISAMSHEGEDIEQPDMPNEIPNPKIGLTLRSRGTIQHDIYEWSRHRSEFSTGLYTLAIAAYEKWGRGEIPYAIVVRLDDTTRTCNQVYTEVQNILAQVEIKTSV